MKILVFGASGYAGSYIKKVLDEKFNNVFGTYRTFRDDYKDNMSMIPYELDDMEGLSDILQKINPDVIISCLTGNFTKLVLLHTTISEYIKRKENGRLIFLSSANVFDGALEKAHFEKDEPKAASEYGKFKIQCEKIICGVLGERGIIIRIPEIYGKNCPRVLKLKEAVQTHNPIKTFQNLYVNYTTDRQIAEWIAYIIENDLTGIFHIGTKDMSDYVAFQKKLVDKLSPGQPFFEITKEPLRLTQAVLPGRNEIPNSMQLHVEDVIHHITGNASL